MSRVFVAEETDLGRKVVIKVLPPDLAAGLSIDRFRREIQLAASLQHPHIVPLLAAGQAGDLLYYTMPLVEGESLRARLARAGELPVPESMRILRDVTDALSYAHRHGLVHRDIKPDNVLLSDHHALVTDFGVAKALDEAARTTSLTATGLALGTPAYMAPEQAAADPHTDQRADIYALGVLGYEILAGWPPFTGPSPQAIVAAQLTQAPTPLVEARPSVPPALAAIIMRCLEKRPADRWQSAAELLDAFEAVGAPGDGVVTTRVTAVSRKSGPRRRPVALLAFGVGLIVAAAGYFIARQSRDSGPLDPNLIAVAPFDVPDPKLSLWREGLVDLLSRSLDGAGPLRSVPPTTVIRRWRGRADRPSALALGRRTGARLLVFGSLIGTGPDSARLTVTALDVEEQRPIAEIELRDAADRMDRLTDSLTVRLLRELGRSRRIEAFRTASVGSTSLPALKAFLQGEQWFRRAAWDSALASYEQAIALDSMFPLALRRAGQVLGWQRSAFDSLAQALTMRAGALNHGLAPRDSLLVTADSLFGTAYSTIPAVDWSIIHRVHAVSQELTRRYPDDFESWYTLGEARIHLGSSVGSSPRQALEAFDQAIAHDSSFAPSYIHAVELALWLEGPQAGSRYTRKYLALGPTDVSASGMKLTEQVMEAVRARPAEIPRLLRNASPGALNDAWQAVRRVADSAEVAIGIARALTAAPPKDARWLTPADRERRLGIALLYRGHARDAVEILYQNPSSLPLEKVEAALLSSSPPDSAAPVFRHWLATGRIIAAAHALPWWAGQRDSASILALRRLSDSVFRSTPNGVDHDLAVYAQGAAVAYLDLVRRDTAAAIRRLETLPDSLCAVCYFKRLTLAQLLSARHDDQKAARLLDQWLIEPLVPSEVLWTLERARVAERLEDREKAARDYQYVADVWRHADPELQPYVTEAREGLARLTGEQRDGEDNPAQ
jgi:eukaryotic-like serine/threonine-protein kinase